MDVRNRLLESFKTHWVNHQDSWKKHEKQRLDLLRSMFYSLGRPDLFDDIENEAKSIFQDFNNKNKKPI